MRVINFSFTNWEYWLNASPRKPSVLYAERIVFHLYILPLHGVQKRRLQSSSAYHHLSRVIRFSITSFF
ncbi:hypothetical protein CW304_08930 [Bacillus sp. UFRGS-B20]|nr:hypothetical protein CW304_08930 [Bacillus sp. UFRGS-B20]